MIYWVSFYNDGQWDTVLETEDINEALDKKKELQKQGLDVIIDYDN